MKQGDRLPAWIKAIYGGVNLPLSFVGFPLVIYLAPSTRASSASRSGWSARPCSSAASPTSSPT
jgi:hypothetical protein